MQTPPLCILAFETHYRFLFTGIVDFGLKIGKQMSWPHLPAAQSLALALRTEAPS